MSLRDSIKDLKNVARRLDNAEFTPEINALKNFVAKFDDKTFSDKPPEDLLQETLNKFLRGEENFTRRERRTLPFIIFDNKITFDGAKKILRQLDFKNKRHLSGLVNVYLNNYDTSNKTELLRQWIIPKEFSEGSARLKKIFSARENFFGENRMANMTKLFAQKLSVDGVLEEIGLTNFYKASNFIQVALINFFRSNAATLPDKFKILDELNAEFETYKNIFPYIADVLIQTVYRTGFDKNKCMEIFYHRLGDPRFGDKRFNWNNVSTKSKEIFCHWLSKEDWEVFTKIVEATALDGQWEHRKKFWNAYLPYIIKTKIFLGRNAKRLAAQIKDKIELNHGSLTKAAANQSAFAFQIGRFIFSEWSHDGKLRVHNLATTVNLFDTVEDFFENDSINRDIIVKNFIEEWIHFPNEGENSWQKKVSEWIGKNCGIYKTEKNWRLEN